MREEGQGNGPDQHTEVFKRQSDAAIKWLHFIVLQGRARKQFEGHTHFEEPKLDTHQRTIAHER